jgi:hypothetical protein
VKGLVVRITSESIAITLSLQPDLDHPRAGRDRASPLIPKGLASLLARRYRNYMC